MSRYPSPIAIAAASQQRSMLSNAGLAVLLTVLAAVPGSRSASAQDGSGNHAGAQALLVARHTHRARHLNIPYDARGYVTPDDTRSSPYQVPYSRSYDDRPSNNNLNPDFQLGGDR
jgi:hypothetical protein